MKLKKNILAILTGTGLMLSACQKENIDIFLPDNVASADTNWVTDIAPSMSVSLLTADLAIPAYTDSIEINNNTTSLITSSGLRCSFRENSLTDSNNIPVSGKITMQSLLLKKKGDMIRLNKSTTSNGYVITSEGMFYIKLKKDGSSVKLATHSKMNIQYAESQPTSPIKLFYGTDAGQGGLNWYLNTDPDNNITALNDGYKVNTNRLNWINAGYLIDSNITQNISINISLAKHFTNANTIAWLVLKHHRSVINLNGDVVNRKFSCTGIPGGKEATILVISRQVDDYYLGREDITTSAGSGNLLSVPVTPVKITLDALMQYINSL
jgi:hypothetical protein